MDNQDLYTTRDLYLAATLLTLKFPVKELNFQYEGEQQLPVGYFSFERNQNLLEAEQAYWRGHLAIEPRTYIANMKSLKSQISNLIKNPLINAK